MTERHSYKQRRVVWLRLPDEPTVGGGWRSFHADMPAILLESRAGSPEPVPGVRGFEVAMATGEPTIRIEFGDGSSETCRFGGWAADERTPPPGGWEDREGRVQGWEVSPGREGIDRQVHLVRIELRTDGPAAMICASPRFTSRAWVPFLRSGIRPCALAGVGVERVPSGVRLSTREWQVDLPRDLMANLADDICEVLDRIGYRDDPAIEPGLGIVNKLGDIEFV